MSLQQRLEKYFVKEEPAKFWKGDYFIAAGALLITAIPNFLFNLSHIIMIFTDLHTMKNLEDPVKIGGYGIGLTIIHTFCYAIIIAITNGSFTLLSQAMGARNYKLMGNIWTYLLYPLWIELFVYQLDMGVKGLGITRSTCEFLSFIVLYAIIKFFYKNELSQSWIPYNTDGFKEWYGFLRVAVPVGLITFMEFSFWEIQTFIVGTLQLVDQLAAHTSYGTIEVFLFYFPLALSFNINANLGNMVGGGKLNQVKNFVSFAQFTNLTLYVIILVSMRLLRGFFAEEFSLEEYRYHFLNIYDIGTIAFIMGDCFQITHSAILRVMGLQDFAAVMMCICYYCIGLPLSFILVYTANLQVYGAWVTLVTVACSASFIMFLKTQFMDHAQCIEMVLKRVQKKDKDLDESPLIKDGIDNESGSIRNSKQKYLEDKALEMTDTRADVTKRFGNDGQ